MITNDVRHLSDNGSTPISLRCLYSFILNTSGRIISDLFIYSFPNRRDQLLIEVDSSIVDKIVSLLKRYKIRRKVAIEPLSEHRGQVVAIYPDLPETCVLQKPRLQCVSSDENLFIVQDPRCHYFGFRFLNLRSTIEINLSILIKRTSDRFTNALFELREERDYRRFRYQNGFGEGAIDFLPENVFPFEANAEVLNGVSFQKGCYIGQELTARTYHTGVIRKRLLPIELIPSEGVSLPISDIPVQNVVHSETGKLMGKFRANINKNGLAVLKFSEILDSVKSPTSKYGNLKLSQTEGIHIRTWCPFWWPESLI